MSVRVKKIYGYNAPIDERRINMVLAELECNGYEVLNIIDTRQDAELVVLFRERKVVIPRYKIFIRVLLSFLKKCKKKEQTND